MSVVASHLLADIHNEFLVKLVYLNCNLSLWEKQTAQAFESGMF